VGELRRLVNLLRCRGAPVRAAALERYRSDLLGAREQRLRDRGQLTFDAQIERTLAALEAPTGAALAARLREDWPVALVDEFQDTDARQYAVLDRIFRGDDGAVRGRVVMIGDPKQAIYGFRGGDVQAYLDASATATHVLRIATNYRSSRALVGALNELFGLAGPALSQSPGHPIAVAPIRASGRPDAAPLTIAGAPVQRPLVFHVSLAARAQRRDDALESCANAIAGLLDARDHRIGDRPLHPGDLAVLLPRNTDIERMRTLLAARRVPCVGAGKGSVFATDIACDLQVLLHGIEHAGDEGLVRAALATRFFGPGIADPRALRARFGSLHEHAQRFARWRQQWRHEGVLAVIQAVVADNAAHLAAGDDAERTLTDLRHLGELLQEQGAACDGPESLLAWFARQRGDDPDREAGEERLLRIESDIGRVQLMTLHASKGLQFPVVFLPLADADATRETKLPLVRRADGGRELDLGSEDHDGSVREAMFDEQDEAFRKLYVALTRAQYLCHVYAMDARSPRADPARAATSALLARLREGLAGRGLHAACAHIEWLAAATWPNAPHAYAPDPAPPVRARMARTPPAAREREGRYSFSLLAGQHAGAFEESIAADEQAGARDGLVADADRPAIEEPAHERLVALTAYRGERFGIALHAIFERRETGRPMRDQHALVRECLEEEGLRVEASAVADLATRVQAALEAPLLPDRADPPRLSALRDASMRTEMGFHYALDGVSMQRLREACARHGEPDLVPSQSSAQLLRGLMTGAIDLVFEHAGRFHVLDYKSNHLGERLGDYAPAALRARMDHHHYRFQALLYTVALDRYLRQRLRGYRREAQLGEAIYLFVRAAGLAPGAGVWSHRFDDALLAEVDDVLAGRRAEAEA
jgi:exodeoxyribonuclease V beta subunit